MVVTSAGADSASMRHYLETFSLLTISTLELAICTLPLDAQTRVAQNPNSFQSSGSAEQTHGKNAVSSRRTAKEMPSGDGMTARDLMGKNVETKFGDKIGSVKDLVIDMRSGRVAYVIVSSGGVAGIGSQEKAVPPSALSTQTTKRNTLSLDMKEDRWKSAPNFDKSQLASLGDQNQMQQIYKYYQKQPPVMASQPPATPAPSPTGRATGTQGQAGNLQLASDLVGKEIVDRQGQDIGKISDLLVDANGTKEVFAVLKPGSRIQESNKQAGKQMYAVPVSSFSPNPGDKDKVMSPLTLDQFQQARPFDRASWPEAGATTGTGNVFRFQPEQFDASDRGTGPDNTGRNRRDRQPGAVTPTSQSESRADLQTTQNIRRSIMKDDSLSTTAKNVKIITANGKVVLRGPVRSEQEKAEISRLAEQVAGAGNVENDLEVNNQ
jgi:sporulation protein YlmC with PRC-barrel domain